MIKTKKIYEAELENGSTFNDNNKEMLLLMPELLSENINKITDFYKKDTQQNTNIHIYDGICKFIKLNNKVGMLGKNDEIIIPFIYDSISIIMKI